MAYNVCSLNCNGIRDMNKRKQLFTWLKDKHYNDIFLQETHSLVGDELQWNQEWANKIYYSHGSSHSKGVAILFKNAINTITAMSKDKEGRIINLKTSLGGKEILFSNIYEPNEDNPTFFQSLISQIIDINCSNIVIGGDFNLVLNTELDKTGGTGRTHTRSSNYVRQMIQNHHLLDIWRIQHPDTKQFTWRRRNPYPIHCRLDMFLISDTIQGCITSSTITSSFRSDHSIDRY